MSDAITIKPMGPGRLYLSDETTFNTYVAPAATDICLALDGSINAGEQKPEADFVAESRTDRDRLQRSVGGVEAAELTFEHRVRGSGTAGTANVILTNMLKNGAGLDETVNAGTNVIYKPNVLNPADSLSATYIDRNSTMMKCYSGGIVKSFNIQCSVDEDPKIAYSASFSKVVTMLRGALNAGIDSSQTTMVFKNVKSLSVGGQGDGASLSIYAMIDSEIVKITAHAYATSTTIARAQLTTTAAAHLENAEIIPYAVAATWPTVAHVGKTNWTMTLGAAAFRTRSFNYQLETGREFDERSAGIVFRDSLHAKGIMGSGSFSYIRSTARDTIARDAQNDASVALALTMGNAAGNIHTLALPICYMGAVPTGLSPESPTEASIDFTTAYDATITAQMSLTLT